jgi:hypothetical protein
MLENKSEPEKYFFIVLDKELDKIAIFYDGTILVIRGFRLVIHIAFWKYRKRR